MKKIIKLLGTFLFLIPILTQASVTLNETQIQSYVKKGYIVSDAYTNSSVCTQTVEKYNQQYSSYNRSECFEANGSYKYFICDKTDSCSITGTSVNEVTSSQQTTSTTTNNNTSTSVSTNVPYKDTLDAFLAKVKKLTSGSNFTSVSNSLLSQLDTLGSKYSSNSDISKMVTYLKTGIKEIQQDYSKDGDIQAFLNDLANTNPTTTSSSSSSSSSSSGGNTANTSCIVQIINGYTLPTRVNGGVSVLTKTVSNNIYEQEFKCNSGTWETRGTEVLKTAANTCGTGKKLKGSLCVTDTSTVNPNGNYTIGQGACAVSNSTNIGYTSSGYSGNLGSSFNSLNINNTLNSCIEACDIGYSNLTSQGTTPRTDLNCFYEGQIIRKLPSGNITNITSTSTSTIPEYVNLVNGLGLTACNQQIVDKFGSQKYTCTIGGGCALNGLTISASNPSANPTQAGACIPKKEWDNAKASTSSSTTTTVKTFTQAEVNAFVQQAGSNYDTIAKAIIDFEKQGYQNLRTQVATALGTTVSVVNDYVTNYQKGTSGTSTPTTTSKTFTQAEVNAFVQQAGSNYDTIAKAIIDFEKQGYQNLRTQVATALGTTVSVVNDYITNYQKGTSGTSTTPTTTTTGWNIKSQGTALCTTVGGGNIGMDGRLQSSTCNVGDVVYQRTNCTQGDIKDQVTYMWTNYECVRK